MHPVIDRLRESLRWAVDGDATDDELLKRTLRATDLSPWSAWTLLSLVRHVERQRWVASIVQTRLRGSPDAIAAGGAFAHPDRVPQHGVVPGLIGWEYYFHGRGCCLTNRQSGEAIDVDFFDDTADWIDPWFFCTHLASLKTPDPIEHHLLQLHSPPETVNIAINELLEQGLLQRREASSKVFRVSADAEHLLPLLDQFGKALLSNRLLPAAMAVGDWFLAAEHSSGCGAELRDSLDIKAMSARDERVRLLLPMVDQQPEALSGLCALNPPELEPVLRKTVRGPAGGTLSRALDHIAVHPDPKWLDDLYALFERLPINGDLPDPNACLKAARILLQNGHRRSDVVHKLRTANYRELGAVALLMLEYAPEFAREQFHQALRSRIPIDRQEAAAILGILSEPWCCEELIKALNACTDQSEAAPLRAALTSMTDPAARDAALSWEQEHPYAAESGPYYTWEHITVNSADAYVQSEMDRFHERVLPLRGRIK